MSTSDSAGGPRAPSSARQGAVLAPNNPSPQAQGTAPAPNDPSCPAQDSTSDPNNPSPQAQGTAPASSAHSGTPHREPRESPGSAREAAPSGSTRKAASGPTRRASPSGGRGRGRGGKVGRRRPSRLRALARDGWIPDQHGAWPMTVLPIVIGAALGGPTWEHLVLGFAWTTAFACFNAVEHWVKSPKRRRSAIIGAVVASGAVAAVSGGAYLAFRPALAWWTVGFAPLVGVALWEVRAGRERSIPARLATIAASSLMLPVAFAVSASGGSPGSVPARVWVAAGVLGAQFAGTVPTVRSMVRGRGDRRWVVGSVLFHALCTAAVAGLAGAGLISFWAVPVWVAMTVRAWAMPAWSERRSRPLAPKVIGPLEFVWVGLLAVALLLP